MLVSIVAGSDKTVASIVTGHQEFYPMYIGPGNVDNPTRWAHGLGILPCAFFPILTGISDYVSIFLMLTIVFIHSWCTWNNDHQVPAVLSPGVPCLSWLYLCPPQGCNDDTWSHSMPWWAFSPSDLLNWTLHCRLPWASLAFWDREWLVSKVSDLPLLLLIHWHMFK